MSVLLVAVVAGIYWFTAKRSADTAPPPPSAEGRPSAKRQSAVANLQPLDSRVTGSVSFSEAGEGGGVKVRYNKGDQVRPELSGATVFADRALVLHERAGASENDVGRPIACGVATVR